MHKTANVIIARTLDISMMVGLRAGERADIVRMGTPIICESAYNCSIVSSMPVLVYK